MLSSKRTYLTVDKHKTFTIYLYWYLSVQNYECDWTFYIPTYLISFVLCIFQCLLNRKTHGINFAVVQMYWHCLLPSIHITHTPIASDLQGPCSRHDASGHDCSSTPMSARRWLGQCAPLGSRADAQSVWALRSCSCQMWQPLTAS